MTTAQIERLKAQERYEHAGALAFILGHDDSYGCHFGMRSTRDSAAEQFRHGWLEAFQACSKVGRVAN